MKDNFWWTLLMRLEDKMALIVHLQNTKDQGDQEPKKYYLWFVHLIARGFLLDNVLATLYFHH